MDKYQKHNIELRKSGLKEYIQAKPICGNTSQKNVYLWREVVTGKSQEVGFRGVGSTLFPTVCRHFVCGFLLLTSLKLFNNDSCSFTVAAGWLSLALAPLL